MEKAPSMADRKYKVISLLQRNSIPLNLLSPAQTSRQLHGVRVIAPSRELREEQLITPK
jgi:hypothetical protein